MKKSHILFTLADQKYAIDLVFVKEVTELNKFIEVSYLNKSFEENLMKNKVSYKEIPKELIENVICLKEQEIIVLDIERIIKKH